MKEKYNRGWGCSAQKVAAKKVLSIKLIVNVTCVTENEFRFKLHQRDDENRELLMTVLVFDLKLRKIT